ncbi:MAG: class I SAM-dependent methyltransferase [Sandaracinaceae bacterium]
MTRRIARYYDDFSRHYEAGRDEGYHALVDELSLRVASSYVAGARVLEAGCGTGLLLHRIALTAERAVGADLSRGMLARARARGLEVVEADLTRLPFADATFDTVCSFKVLAHVPDRRRALAELARVTRPGGHLVLEFYNRRSLRYLVRRVAGARRIGRDHRENDIPTRWDTLEELEASFPAELRLLAWRGIRVLTPAAAVHRMPLLGAALRAAERAALGSVLAPYGGFLVAVLRRVDHRAEASPRVLPP